MLIDPLCIERSVLFQHYDFLFNHIMDMLWEKFQWILPPYMKPISFKSKASVVCSAQSYLLIFA